MMVIIQQYAAVLRVVSVNAKIVSLGWDACTRGWVEVSCLYQHHNQWKNEYVLCALHTLSIK